MEIQFQPGENVKVAGLNRPCIVLSVRTHDRKFDGRKDREGTKVQLEEPHYTVQLHGSSSTRLAAQSKLKRIPAAEMEIELAAAEALPTGPNQSISPVAANAASARARRQAIADEKARLKAELEEAEEQAELDAMKTKLEALKKPN